jgi:membrane protease YdiL (CAAX protease family)
MEDDIKINGETAAPAGDSGPKPESPQRSLPGIEQGCANAPDGPIEILAEPIRPIITAPSTEPDLWRARDLLLFVGFSVGWAFMSGLLLMAGYAVLRPLMGWRTPVSALADNTFFGLLVQLVLYGPVLLYIVLLVVMHYQLPFWAGIRWRWPNGGNAVKLLLSGVLLALLVAAGSALVPDRRNFPLEKMFSSPAAAYALGAFAVLVAPFMEELIFRGVLFAFFERMAGLRWAVALSALLFAALHYSEYQGAWTHLGMILVVGVVFSVARALTGSVAPGFLLHTAYNGTFILALFLGTHHFKNLQTLGGAG